MTLAYSKGQRYSFKLLTTFGLVLTYLSTTFGEEHDLIGETIGGCVRRWIRSRPHLLKHFTEIDFRMFCAKGKEISSLASGGGGGASPLTPAQQAYMSNLGTCEGAKCFPNAAALNQWLDTKKSKRKSGSDLAQDKATVAEICSRVASCTTGPQAFPALGEKGPGGQKRQAKLFWDWKRKCNDISDRLADKGLQLSSWAGTGSGASQSAAGRRTKNRFKESELLRPPVQEQLRPRKTTTRFPQGPPFGPAKSLPFKPPFTKPPPLTFPPVVIMPEIPQFVPPQSRQFMVPPQGQPPPLTFPSVVFMPAPPVEMFPVSKPVFPKPPASNVQKPTTPSHSPTAATSTTPHPEASNHKSIQTTTGTPLAPPAKPATKPATTAAHITKPATTAVARATTTAVAPHAPQAASAPAPAVQSHQHQQSSSTSGLSCEAGNSVWKGKATIPFVEDMTDSIEAALQESGHQDVRSKRREFRTLSRSERLAVLKAFDRLKSEKIDGVAKYDLFVIVHDPKTALGSHGGPAFLPFHRELLKRVELGLRQFDPSLSLPYWDTTMDHGLPNPADSILWTDDFFGNNKGPVTSGTFANWMANFPEKDKRPLDRNVGEKKGPMNLTDIELTQSKQDFKDVTCEEPIFELAHAKVHLYVGGQMGKLDTAPNDPVFYMHHAFLDSLWEEFRMMHQNRKSREHDFPPDDLECWKQYTNPKRFSGKERMLPFDLVNMDGVSNKYTDNFYSYEPRPFCNDLQTDCGSDNLFCDMKEFRCLSKVRPGGNCAGFEGSKPCFQGSCKGGVCP